MSDSKIPLEAARPRARILVVDDVTENLHTVLGILGQEFAVLAATAGEKALELARRRPRPDLILLDIRMPGMNGYEVMNRLRADPETAEIPVIFLTALTDAEDEAVGLRLGAADYISKPVNPELLLIRIRNQLELRRHRRVLGTSISRELARPPGKPTLLVVDDMPENVHALVAALQSEYRIVVASDGVRAIELVDGSHPPDAVLLDVKMPGLDGYQVCSAIKALPAGRNLPVIFVTVVGSLEDKVRGFAVGAADYITKPFEIEEVRARLRTHLDLNQLRRSLEELIGVRMAALRDANEALEISREKYRVLAEYSPNWEYWVAPDGEYLYVSPACTEVSGYAPVDFVADPGLMRKMIHPDDLAIWDGISDAALDGAARRLPPFRIRRRDGAERWIEHVRLPVLGAGKRYLGTRGTHRDITLQRRAEEELRLSALVFANAAEAIAVTGADNRILMVNEAFSEITGYPADTVHQLPIDMIQAPWPDTAHDAEVRQTLRRGDRWNAEVECQHRDGRRFFAWMTASALTGSDGQVDRRIYLFSDITARKQAENLIWQQANYDGLTGLPNRRLFNDRLDQEILRASREEATLAILFIDLDRFKEINDTVGHEVGDQILIEAGRRIQECLRPYDTVARLGGDEFLVILSQLPHSAGVERRVGEEIIETLLQPFRVADGEHIVSASIGIALYPHDGRTVSELTKQADQAMYLAKRSGRGCLRYFTRALQLDADRRQHVIKELRQAHDGKRFEVHYQPIIELASGRVCKAEALLRWNHPEDGPISPALFIPLAEDSGQIREIGNWVFEQVLQQARRWIPLFGPEFQIGLNVSPVQLNGPSETFSGWIEAIRANGLHGRNLAVEITEGMLLDSNPLIVHNLMLLREAGVQIVVDDFGMGYSTLGYLKRFVVDALKIDQFFVQHLEDNQTDIALCKAIVAMAHTIGIPVVGEGVETAAQRAALSGIGCDLAQGFLFAPALPPAEFEQRFAAPGRGNWA